MPVHGLIVFLGLAGAAAGIISAMLFPPSAKAEQPGACGCVYREFHVGFAWNDATTSPMETLTVQMAAAYYRNQRIRPKSIRIDASANAGEENDIALRRAQAIEDLLVADGVPRAVVVAKSLGSLSSLDPASADPKDPHNRMALVSMG